MPSLMAALPNIGDALCWTPQFGWRPLLECRAVTDELQQSLPPGDLSSSPAVKFDCRLHYATNNIVATKNTKLRRSLVQMCLHTSIVQICPPLRLAKLLTSHYDGDPKTGSSQISFHHSHALLKHSTCIIQVQFDWRLPASFKQADRVSHVRPTPPLIRLSVSNTDKYNQEDHWISTFLPFSSSRQSLLQTDCSTGQHVPLNDTKHTLNTSTNIQDICDKIHSMHTTESLLVQNIHKFSQNNHDSFDLSFYDIHIGLHDITITDAVTVHMTK